ncbi:hypothetical protein JYT21_00025 [bacterium AH-315-B15]|nr:hypothetical protein [bacterium AH-315-B15]
MRFLSILLVLILNNSFGQIEGIGEISKEDLSKAKAVKKEIPIKGIKKVHPIESEVDLFFFSTKTSTGLYDNSSKSIIFKEIKSLKAPAFGKGIWQFEADGAYGLFRLLDKKLLFKSNVRFKTAESLDTNFILIISEDAFGMFDLERNDCYCVSESNKPANPKKFFSQGYDDSYEPYKRSAAYDPKTDEVVYTGFWSDEIQNSNTMFRRDGFVFEYLDGYQHGTQVINAKTAEVKIDFSVDINSWSGGYYEYVYGELGFDEYDYFEGRTFYDKDFELLAKEVDINNMSLETFQLLFDKNAFRIDHLEKLDYQISTDSGQYFFSLGTMEYEGGPYDQIIDVGTDLFMSGHAYFIRKGNLLGFYNSQQGEIVPPLYRKVETLAMEDGNYAYRADRQLMKMAGKGDFYDRHFELTAQVPLKGKELLTTSPINHASIENDLLIISSRKSEARESEEQPGTLETDYDHSSGVYNFKAKKWIIEPHYHLFQPFLGHYLATKDESIWGRNLTSLEILDKEYEPITTTKYYTPMIYQGKLYVQNEKFELIEFDVVKNKEVKNYGDLDIKAGDFMLWDNHLFMGSKKFFSYDATLSGFDIDAVIDPAGEIVQLDAGMELQTPIINGLITVQIYETNKEGKREQKGARIYDLRTKKFLTPIVRDISVYSKEVTIFMETSAKEREKNPDKLRKHFSIPFSNLRTFYTTM